MPPDKPNNPDDDRTLIMPRPGGAGPGKTPLGGAAPAGPPGGVSPPPPSSSPPAGAMPADARLVSSGVNPLAGAAAGLLALAGQLRHSVSHNDIPGLRRKLIEEVKRFESEAQARGIRPEVVITARYILCAVLDEMVLSTPWGSESEWSHQSLLSTFHNETLGGKKFFLILERVMPDPATNLDLLELMYLCLSIGFKGKYMLQEGGEQQLEDLRSRLFGVIRAQRGEIEQELSPRWEPVFNHGDQLARYIPLWVVAAVAGALLVTVYAGFTFMLGSAASPVHTQLEEMAPPGAWLGSDVSKNGSTGVKQAGSP